MISRWHILISGFTQTLGGATGTRRLWLELRELSSADCSVQIYPWNTEWREVAAFVRGCSYPSVAINVYGYSWGGNGAVQLAEALAEEGLVVDQLLLCDAVWRSNLLPSWLPANPLSLLSAPKLKVPVNVRHVKWCYQRQDRPRGHVPVARGSSTFISEGVQVDLPHAGMDDSVEWWGMVREAAFGRAA